MMWNSNTLDNEHRMILFPPPHRMQNRAIMLRYKKDKKTQEKKIPKNPIHRRGKASGPPPKKNQKNKIYKENKGKKNADIGS